MYPCVPTNFYRGLSTARRLAVGRKANSGAGERMNESGRYMEDTAVGRF